MKKYTLHILLGIPVILIALVLFFGIGKTERANANPSSESITTNATSTTNSLATTTAQSPFLLATAATSTKEFDPQNGNIIQAYFAIYSTSTPPKLTVGLEMSNNGIDWYSFEESPAAGNPTALVSGKPTNLWSWVAATTTDDETVYKSFVLTNSFVGKYARLLYKVTGNNAAAQVHAEIAVKKEF